MSIAYALLGLLVAGPSHGYQLKQSFDEKLGHRPLHYGQVYTALSRLTREGLVEAGGTETADGPERKRYALTEAGAAALDGWLLSPETPEPYLRSTLYTKLTVALLTGRDTALLLDTHRTEYLRRMRALTRLKQHSDPREQVAQAWELFHLEADLRFLEYTVGRLEALGPLVRDQQAEDAPGHDPTLESA
ncbi:helix-turn-helix transcriptional regulator [Streptomyces sp. NPDC059459]|uniref:helix-turn-helix transcriptional regulator n=1 Tax=Streptomyces sp. NPDC059459 TaxID=3346839 RepID=UPI0036C101C7